MTVWTSPSEGTAALDAAPFSRAEFEARLREKERFYHIHHPFQAAMAAGELTPDQIRSWVLNRFYYQLKIPQKDAAILANCPDREVRRHWVQRILDHDGIGADPGGIEAWIQLGNACGLVREDIVSLRHVLPGVRFAVDAYVTFAREASWEEAAVSSLTELFAPKIHRQRLTGWPELYPWIAPEGLAYFQKRLGEARRDVEHGLAIALDRFTTRPAQERALAILQFKLDILWSMLDALWLASVEGRPPYFNVPR